MSDWKLVRLNFGRSPVHFGETGIGLEETTERIRSDTLFSAWVSAYARIFGKNAVEALLKQFTDNPDRPPFRVSSTFVYRRLENDQFIDYLPKLIERPMGYPDNDLAFAKTYKTLGYLPLEVWQRWYQGDGFSEEDKAELKAHADKPDEKETALVKAGCFAYSEAFKRYELPKVAIDRTTRATNFYHTGLIQFAWQPQENDETEAWGNTGTRNQAGLYFLVEFPETSPEQEADLKQALAILGEEGIGGERSSGAGRFTVLAWEALPAHWQTVVTFDGGNHHSLVSLFWDKNLKPDWLGASARYAIQERGGWIASPFSGRQLRRQMVRMFAEGSVFPNKPGGELANVTPSGFTKHSVYRSGLAISLPVKLEAATD